MTTNTDCRDSDRSAAVAAVQHAPSFCCGRPRTGAIWFLVDPDLRRVDVAFCRRCFLNGGRDRAQQMINRAAECQ